MGFLHPQDGLMVHTNHFLTPRLQAGDRGIAESDNMLLRYGRAVRLLRAQIGRITVEMLKGIFRDHFNHPKSICRHPDPSQPEIERSATLASMIVDLTAGEVHLTVGEPCGTEYQEITAKSVIKRLLDYRNSQFNAWELTFRQTPIILSVKGIGIALNNCQSALLASNFTFSAKLSEP